MQECSCVCAPAHTYTHTSCKEYWAHEWCKHLIQFTLFIYTHSTSRKKDQIQKKMVNAQTHSSLLWAMLVCIFGITYRQVIVFVIDRKRIIEKLVPLHDKMFHGKYITYIQCNYDLYFSMQAMMLISWLRYEKSY